MFKAYNFVECELSFLHIYIYIFKYKQQHVYKRIHRETYVSALNITKRLAFIIAIKVVPDLHNLSRAGFKLYVLIFSHVNFYSAKIESFLVYKLFFQNIYIHKHKTTLFVAHKNMMIKKF